VTTAAFRRNSDNFCYRHPDRVSFVLCQRCLRTICPECQTQGAVGVICPECMRDQQKAQSTAQKKAEKRAYRPRPVALSDSRPLATYAIIGATAVVYLLSGIGGSVAVALLAPGVWVVGASGAIFGLFGALLVIGRHIGANIRNIAIVIGINFLWPFASALVSSIGRGSFTEALAAIQVSWQAHLGGLLTGALVGLIYARTRTAQRRTAQIWLLVGVGVGLLALLVIPPLLYT